MNADVIDKSLKARIELLKMYLILIIGLVTGISGLLYKESSQLTLILIVFAAFMLIVISVFAIVTFIKINSLIKKIVTTQQVLFCHRFTD